RSTRTRRRQSSRSPITASSATSSRQCQSSTPRCLSDQFKVLEAAQQFALYIGCWLVRTTQKREYEIRMDQTGEQARLWAIAEAQPNFANHLGLRITSVSRDRVEADLPVVEALANRNGVMHGGAIMALADNL